MITETHYNIGDRVTDLPTIGESERVFVEEYRDICGVKLPVLRAEGKAPFCIVPDASTHDRFHRVAPETAWTFIAVPPARSAVRELVEQLADDLELREADVVRLVHAAAGEMRRRL